jgi:hypothetical protein
MVRQSPPAADPISTIIVSGGGTDDHGRPAGCRPREHSARRIEMVWIITGGIIYLILVITLGVMSIRKGHWVMFIIGFFLPFFWLIGALMPSRRLAY